MSEFRLLLAQLVAAFILAILAWAAASYSLYWRWWWFDVPMHFLGGMWIALGAVWLLVRRGKSFSLAWCLTFALVIGIAWEIFEYAEGVSASRLLGYPLDTAKDVAMDLLGAWTGYSVARVGQVRDTNTIQRVV